MLGLTFFLLFILRLRTIGQISQSAPSTGKLSYGRKSGKHISNCQQHSGQVAADPTTPLLWVLRDNLGLSGTKFGCGQGLCGACTVLLNGEAVRSCQVTLKAVKQAKVVTIKGFERINT
ncbi:MAG: 2Fe-2S iron-sulfur cluster binding domain-containing protein [Anaerolineae bacterium]|nr:2Fe-2S iron-sulfur cluster binding domain-containing protein [Gloeobacterales cyanobacterium ES-bin-313]